MKIVIALGGNALGETPELQKEMAKVTAEKLIPLIKEGHEIILTHGNGPQVGLINLAFNEGNKVNEKVYLMPFPECGAMSEGYIGYHLQNALKNELIKNNINRNVTSIVTMVEVDKNDPAFLNPTKPIGSFYSKEEIEKLGYPYKEDAKRGYRRVIASPKPIGVVEQDTIKSLIESGNIVITCGGGGIPVVKENNQYVGIDAVIDKDFASSLLATNINADCLLILTAVNNAVINFRQENETPLFDISLKDAIKYNEEGHFASGSMKPKVEACIKFVESSNKVAIITSIENAIDALHGNGGTRIYK